MRKSLDSEIRVPASNSSGQKDTRKKQTIECFPVLSLFFLKAVGVEAWSMVVVARGSFGFLGASVSVAL